MVLLHVLLVALWLSGGCLTEHIVSKRQTDKQSIRVVSIESEPYLMAAKGPDGSWKDWEYKGYIADLIETVCSFNEIDCKIHVVKDGKYGRRQPDGTWNGMVGELMRGEADIAAAPLTINSMRAQVVDFSKPFMTADLSTLVKKQTGPGSPFFWLLRPFSTEVWIVVLVITAVCCVFMFLLNRFAPEPRKEETETRTCGAESGRLCAAVAKLLGVEGNQPQAVSVSIFLVTWRTFLLFTGALYISSLVSCVLNSPVVAMQPYETFDGLLQSSVPAGYISGSSTEAFFQTSKVAPFARMYMRINSESPATTVPTLTEGIKRAEKGNYAFIAEAPALEYAAQHNCDLVKIGAVHSTVGYGLATPLGSDLRAGIDRAIVEMTDKGHLNKMYAKWFKVGDGCGQETFSKSSSSSSQRAPTITLQKYMHYGVVVLLVVGLALTTVAAVVEKMLERKQQGQRKISKAEKVDETAA